MHPGILSQKGKECKPAANPESKRLGLGMPLPSLGQLLGIDDLEGKVGIGCELSQRNRPQWPGLHHSRLPAPHQD